MKILHDIYDYMGRCVTSPRATWWLSFFFFIESCIFPIPVDPLLILFCLRQQRKSFYFATIATTASVFGGLFGYFLGAWAWGLIGNLTLRYVISPELFTRATAYYRDYEAAAVLIAAFTPIPYKAVTLSAGFCSLPLLPFITYSIIGRGARFFLEALLLFFWGEAIGTFIDKHFDRLVVAFSLLLLAGFYLLHTC